MPGLVVFNHGKESGPWGSKILRLAETARMLDFAVESLDYEGVFDPGIRLKMLLDRADALRTSPRLVLVGSSMGGYVAAAASAVLRPVGLFLMAPAVYIAGYPIWEPVPFGQVQMVVHGWQDEVIPVEHSQRYAQKFGMQLCVLADDHRLSGDLAGLAGLFGLFLEQVNALPDDVLNTPRQTRFTQITTPRLVIRRFRDTDAESLASYRSDPEVARYQSWKDLSVDAALRFITRLHPLEPGVAGEWFQFALELKEAGIHIGDIGLFVRADDPQQAEIGFTLARAYQGYGYAEEAVSAVLGYGFNTLGLHRVTATVDTRNAASIRLLERLGYRREAFWVQSYRDQENWTDEYQFALLCSEWQARTAATKASK
jgi:RimJ/RimL family protein N-acetyltransferase